MSVVRPLLGQRGRGGGAEAGVQFGHGAVSPLTVLLKRLWLHHLPAVAAHHQVEVVVAWVEAEDRHVCEHKQQLHQAAENTPHLWSAQ